MYKVNLTRSWKKREKMVVGSNVIVDAINKNSIGVKEIEKFKMQMIERTN